MVTTGSKSESTPATSTILRDTVNGPGSSPLIVESLSPRPMPPPASIPLTALRDKNPLDVISQPFAPFDHQSSIVKPYSDENSRDVTFERELSGRLLDIVIETHAWASAKSKHESNAAVQRFEKKISNLMEIEKEQGNIYFLPFEFIPSFMERTRERLNDFVSRVKTALAALI